MKELNGINFYLKIDIINRINKCQSVLDKILDYINADYIILSDKNISNGKKLKYYSQNVYDKVVDFINQNPDTNLFWKNNHINGKYSLKFIAKTLNCDKSLVKTLCKKLHLTGEMSFSNRTLFSKREYDLILEEYKHYDYKEQIKETRLENTETIRNELNKKYDDDFLLIKEVSEKFNVSECRVIHYMKCNNLKYVCKNYRKFISSKDWKNMSFDKNLTRGGYKSIGEKITAWYLEKHNIEFINEWKSLKSKKVNNRQYYLPFDFYIPKYNICIEVQGKQHLKESYSLKDHDLLKRKFCNENGIKLIELVWINDVDFLIKQLDENLNIEL